MCWSHQELVAVEDAGVAGATGMLDFSKRLIEKSRAKKEDRTMHSQDDMREAASPSSLTR